MGLTTFGIVDTNSDPNKINFAIPGNDDSSKSIEYITNYLVECKKYFLDNKKYMRYARLLRSALQYAKYFEGTDFIPKDFKEYKKFLKNPFIYCMLEPYNIIDRQEASICMAFFIDGEIIFTEEI